MSSYFWILLSSTFCFIINLQSSPSKEISIMQFLFHWFLFCGFPVSFSLFLFSCHLQGIKIQQISATITISGKWQKIRNYELIFDNLLEIHHFPFLFLFHNFIRRLQENGNIKMYQQKDFLFSKLQNFGNSFIL